jgi:hypothetical protein
VGLLLALALLRLASPRLEATMWGSLLLAAWVDFLNLLDVVFTHGYRAVETLFMDMGWRRHTTNYRAACTRHSAMGPRCKACG